MKRVRNVWTMYLFVMLTAASLAAVATSASAADEKKDAAAAGGATGTWRWTFTTQDGQERQTTLKLKQDGEKLTGTVTGRNNQESEITDGKVKGNQVSFKVVRKFNDREVTSTYQGRLDGDAIKGKIETTGGEQNRPARDWEAKRVKDDKAGGDKAAEKKDE